MYQFKNEDEKRKILRRIIESEFSFSDLEPTYAGAAPNTANVFCVFHHHTYSSPSAKFYWDDEKDILVLHCFRERRTYTVFDLVEKVLCKERGEYKNCEDFCIRELGERDYAELVDVYSKLVHTEDSSITERKREYINNLYNKYDDVNKFIECLYLEKD